jgi:hypothetical protein
MLLVHDDHGMSAAATAGVPSISINPAVASIPAAVACLIFRREYPHHSAGSRFSFMNVSKNKILFNGVPVVANSLLLLAPCFWCLSVMFLSCLLLHVGVPSVAKTHAVAILSLMFLLHLLLC